MKNNILIDKIKNSSHKQINVNFLLKNNNNIQIIKSFNSYKKIDKKLNIFIKKNNNKTSINKKQRVKIIDNPNFNEIKTKEQFILKKNYFCNCESNLNNLWLNSIEKKNYCFKTLEWVKNSNNGYKIYTKSSKNFENKIDLDLVKKDFNRTFKKIHELNNENILKELIEITTKLKYDNDNFSYFQGMSFIISSVRYHCNKKYTIKLVNLLFKKLKMNLVYNNFNLNIKKIMKIFKKQLKLNDNEIFIKLEKLNFSYEIFLMEWLFTLGFWKIPLNMNHEHINNLIKKGWTYFFQLLIQIILYFKKEINKINCSIDLMEFIKTKNNFSEEKYESLIYESKNIKIIDSPLNIF